MLGILAELYHPGTIFPGVLGAICLLLGFISMQVLPISYGAALLLLFGVVLLVVELFTPTYGLLGAGGVVAMVLGAVMLVDDVDPAWYFEPTFTVSWFAIAPTTLFVALFVLVTGYYVVKARVSRPVTGGEGMVGEVGRVLRTVGPAAGKVEVHGELWNAIANREIPPGAAVRVVLVENLRIRVEPVMGSEPDGVAPGGSDT
jgi:membrane-bound serine protease (ClpP class)